jgi:4-hydroxymandelate oxidase
MTEIPGEPTALETAALAALSAADPAAARYFEQGSGDDVTRDANRGAWASLLLRPRVLRAVGAVATTTSVVGTPLPDPIVVAPMAVQRLAHADGERATVAGAGARGTPVVVSMAATTAVEALAPLAPVWMQLYVLRDRGRTRALCERAEAAGCRALMVSVDGAAVPMGTRRSIDRLVLPRGISFPNLAPPGEPPPTDLAALTREYDPTLVPDDLAAIAGSTTLPLVVKGVMRGDDARRCVDVGAAGVVVSNHGGRMLDGTMATADALAAVVDAVGDEAHVLVDGGIRRGSDVLRALALGARAVLVGRPVIWGLALGGAAGVTQVLDDLAGDLRRALAACGAPSPADVSRDLIADRL